MSAHVMHQCRLRVVMIYRKPRIGRHSIEEVFGSISHELTATDEVIEYRCGSRWAMALDAIRLRRLRADMYHVTGDIHYMALLLPRHRTVLTVHDLRLWSARLSGWRYWLYWLLWVYLPIRCAASVVAISDFTRQQICTAAGISNIQVGVIPNPVSPMFVPTERPFNSKHPTILQVGTNDKKNLERVTEAISGMHVHLSVIGRLSGALRTLLAMHRIDFSNHFDLRLTEVSQCYAESDIVCFVSLFEGFGMPIIEAQAVGRPVITSNIEPMISVAGGAALLVDPTDVMDIRAAISRLIESEELRKDLVRKGLLLSSKRSVNQVAGSYRRLYLNLRNKQTAAPALFP